VERPEVTRSAVSGTSGKAEQPANSAGDERHFLSGWVRAIQGDHLVELNPATTCCGRLIPHGVGDSATTRPCFIISRLPRTQPAASPPSARCDAGSAPAAGTAAASTAAR
jgi:hypothetical protein